uniref:Nucleoporin NUP53 n=1 Tax=Steinernema glaseri TaxID=37863 RepID=A0A1I7ZCR8_9BILA
MNFDRGNLTAASAHNSWIHNSPEHVFLVIRINNKKAVASYASEMNAMSIDETVPHAKAVVACTTSSLTGNPTLEAILKEPRRPANPETAHPYACPFGPIGAKIKKSKVKSSESLANMPDYSLFDVPDSAIADLYWPVTSGNVWDPTSAPREEQFATQEEWPLPENRSIQKPKRSPVRLPWSSPNKNVKYSKHIRNIENSEYLREPLIRVQSSTLLEEFERTMPHLFC